MPFYSALLRGWKGLRLQILCRAEAKGKGLSLFGNVGPVLREAKAIVPLAFDSQGLPVPEGKLTVQLQPIDEPKNLASLYLGLALAIFCQYVQTGASADFDSSVEKDRHSDDDDELEKDIRRTQEILEWAQRIQSMSDRNYFCIGELNIYGEVIRINGALSLLDQAKPGDIVILPEANLHEAQFWTRTSEMGPGVETYAVASLREACEILSGERKAEPVGQKQLPRFKPCPQPNVDFSDIVNQDDAKRALEIAAAGGHHCLLYGPKGEGKSLLAKALPGILPRLDPQVNMDEILETNRIWSAKGLLEDGQLVIHRPFRDVAPGISEAGLFGGGAGIPQPGEISLAHRGVLLMDEFAQFPPHILEKLRGPLQDKKITIGRARSTYTFPAAFILVAAMNPCRCSYYGEYICKRCGMIVPQGRVLCTCGSGDLLHRCNCGAPARRRFERLLSGPLEDRVHLKVRVYSSTLPLKLTAGSPGESSRTIRRRVERARKMQAQRFEGSSRTLNSEVETPREIYELFSPTKGAQLLVERLPHSLPYPVSMRTKVQTLLVARTIADLEEDSEMNALHVAEAALRYTRPLLARIEERKDFPISSEALLDRAGIGTP